MSTLNENITQAINDFDEIKEAIIEKGVDVPVGTATSDYDDKIREIETGIHPSGTIEIAENGTHDVTEYAEADVNVVSKYTATTNVVFQKVGGTIIKGSITIDGEMPVDLSLSDAITIDDFAFHGCDAVTSINLPDTIYQIGVYAFSNCNKLRSLVIPDRVGTISNNAFDRCYSLTSLTLGNSVTTIGAEAFKQCVILPSLVIPDSVTSIGNEAFLECRNLSSLTFGTNLLSIGDSAFNSCASLRTLTVAGSVQTISSQAFYGCRSLISLILGSSITSIGAEAFASSESSLTDIYYNGTQTEWEQITIGTDAIPAGATIHYDYILE